MPTIQSILEEEDKSPLGFEIDYIQDWFSKKFEESYSFDWDGDILKIFDENKHEIQKLTRAEVETEINGFPQRLYREPQKRIVDDGLNTK